MGRLCILTLILCTAMLFRAAGQDFGEYKSDYEEQRGKTGSVTLNIAGGLSSPLGQFASDDYLNAYSGYAGSGAYLSLLGATYWVHKHYGVGGNWFRGAYAFDVSRYFNPYNLYNPGLYFEGQAEKWMVQSLCATGVASVPGKVADLDIRISTGLGTVRRPEIAAVVSDSNGMQVVRWAQARTTAFTVSFGAGLNLRFHIVKGFDAMLNIEYQRMKANFLVPQVYNGRVLDEEEITHPVEVLHTGIGVAVTL